MIYIICLFQGMYMLRESQAILVCTNYTVNNHVFVFVTTEFNIIEVVIIKFVKMQLCYVKSFT